MEREVGQFEAIGDDGSVYTIFEIQEFVEVNAIGQPRHWINGMKRLELDDGSPVTYADSNSFKIVLTGQIVRKID